MPWTNTRRVLTACLTVACLLAAPSRSSAACALWDWMFGNGQTSYAPPYARPRSALRCQRQHAAARPRRPAAASRPNAAPACQSCTPTATYRISYRPVPTVAYMPVVGVDPCSGCAVTTYRPTTAWTYRASLASYPTYRVGYAPVAVSAVSCAPCSSCSSCGGCAPAAVIRLLAADVLRAARIMEAVRHAARLIAAAHRAAQAMAGARRATRESPAAMSRRAVARPARRARRRWPRHRCQVPAT